MKRPRPAKNYYSQLDSGELDSGLEESPNKEQPTHWSEPVIEELIYAGLKPNRIMRIINTFIMHAKKDEDFMGTTKIRTKVDSILTSRKDEKRMLRYIGT